jgi:hypothetical protein
VALFQRRLATPVGELPEDRPPVEAGQRVVFPFRIVGVCTLLIGLLMLSTEPWLTVDRARWLNFLTGGGLALIGGLIVWLSPGAKTAAPEPSSVVGPGD